jgi:hypothetical protein
MPKRKLAPEIKLVICIEKVPESKFERDSLSNSKIHRFAQ